MQDFQKRRFVAFVGVRAGLEELLDWLKAQDIYSLLISSKCTLKESLTYDYCLDVDLDDEAAVIDAIKALPSWVELACFYTTNEYRVPVAAKLANYFKVGKSVAVDGAVNCRNKKLVRKILFDNGLSKLKYKLVKSSKEVMAASMFLRFPVIVKPSNDAGSRFVFKCDDMLEACAAVNEITANTTNYVGQSIDPEILIEEMAVGPEYSVESCTVNGVTHVIAITQKETSGPPRFIEQSHFVPALFDSEQEQRIKQLVIQSHQRVGIDNVVTHTEFKLTPSGPEIIEINGRPGGDHIPELVKYTTGICLSELGAHIAMGNEFETYVKHPVIAESAAVQFFLANENGEVEYMAPKTVMPQIVKSQITVQPNSQVVETTNNYNRLGYVLAISSNNDALQVTQNYIDSIGFKVTANGCCT
ncbi:ATP-grasp domain-containing protein [Pseudoalteromonas luteoviolacea]|uniref:ATP-grasp domain-containing protein n=1 Tax=Pseudoalteromonas luteoviolacea S4054 TaxID=1129367 RepID=A0A0F6AC08_9GAMM|nr:ATP-grasp domain-containing protein [Pseudoalteromonas luteoviolacea]AOT10598.1 hypothetical protein S4054249_22305 [Pseudoalteromonas luteoviolacea]AOT15334.1 hypothetical protein S40542_21290 [Pseudoalteromonas luteoviolacea]AOT20417.1 hypothetical protein S4054_22220 [Pseudoalteromonas luteoviolacea]KKE83693.1 hypothetical protein N479_12770 [Pseudoalteromonas luteoviolacea S4054]KZN71896.1 hypothetical protein N481_17130 [Pseudoalteromonas luteoviolacea S4047-1]